MKSVSIKRAEQLAKECDQQAVVIIGISRNGDIKMVTYGENKAKCKAIGDWAKGLYGWLEKHAFSVIPFQTVFGWGNKGVPKPLTPEQESELIRLGVRCG